MRRMWHGLEIVVVGLPPLIEPYSALKPTKVGLIIIGPNSLSRAEAVNQVTQAVNHVTQAVVRVGLKIGS